MKPFAIKSFFILLFIMIVSSHNILTADKNLSLIRYLDLITAQRCPDTSYCREFSSGNSNNRTTLSNSVSILNINPQRSKIPDIFFINGSASGNDQFQITAKCIQHRFKKFSSQVNSKFQKYIADFHHPSQSDIFSFFACGIPDFFMHDFNHQRH